MMCTEANGHGNGHVVDQYHNSERGIAAAMHLVQTTALPFALRAAMKLGIFDILKEAGPDSQLTAEEIVSRIANPKATAPDSKKLDLLLRLLASHNIVTELVEQSPSQANGVERRYGTTATVECLRSSVGESLASLLLLHTDPLFVGTMDYLDEIILDDTAQASALANGTEVFQCIKNGSALGKLFNRAMADATTFMMSLLLQTYKGFEGLSSLVDVGGGIGANLAVVLSKYPQLRGINFDQPHTVACGLQVQRLEHIAGDFFVSVPEGDAVFMKWVLHDWSDELCIKILKNVEKALPPHGKVINIDAVLPEVSDSSVKTQTGLASQLLMMTYNDGKERTLREFQSLAKAAGFLRVEVVATVVDQTVLEFYKC